MQTKLISSPYYLTMAEFRKQKIHTLQQKVLLLIKQGKYETEEYKEVYKEYDRWRRE